jgi:hypothetical protein
MKDKLITLLSKIKLKTAYWITTFYQWADWYFRKKSYREFIVTKSPKMPSLVGMYLIGQASVGKQSIFISLKADNEYRTIIPLVIRKLDAENFQLFSSHLSLQIKRIK